MTIDALLSSEPPSLRAQLTEFLAGLPGDTPTTVLRCGPGETILSQDAPCGPVYVLLEGRAVASGLQPGYAAHTYSEFGPPSLFGEYELLCGADTYLAEVRAKTPCRFLVLSRESYFVWFFSSRGTTLSRVREVVRTLWDQARRERSYLFLDSDSRFLYFLVTWYESNADGGTVRIPMTRAAIGDETGVCPRTVNRNVRAFLDRGLLTLHSGKILLSHSQYLRLREELERRLADGRALH